MQIRENRRDVAEPRFLCDNSSKSILNTTHSLGKVVLTTLSKRTIWWKSLIINSEIYINFKTRDKADKIRLCTI